MVGKLFVIINSCFIVFVAMFILSRMLDNSDNAPMLDLPINRRLLTFIISFMGSSGRIKNPHLR